MCLGKRWARVGAPPEAALCPGLVYLTEWAAWGRHFDACPPVQEPRGAPRLQQPA